MKEFSQLWTSVSDKGHGAREVVLAHGGLEVGQGLMLWLAMSCAPLDEKADDQAPEHSKDPQCIGAPNTTSIFIE